jgi:hypothetical protein
MFGISATGIYTLPDTKRHMDDDLVLLTSYFNLANGRRQDTADTFRVDPSLPSKTSPDGTAALYIVTEASTGGHMGPRARRLAADTIAWEYSTHGDDQPAPRLRAALRTAHQEVAREFDGHVSVGVSVIAVEHDQVYLAQVAPAQVYVLHEGSLHSVSAAVSGSSPYSHSLGAAAGPEISVFRDEVGPGDVLALCSSWFNRSADSDSLRGSFGAGTAEDIAEALFDLAKDHGIRDASCVIIDAIRARDMEAIDEEAPRSFLEQVDMAVQALAGVGRMFVSELRAAPSSEDNNGNRSATLERRDTGIRSTPSASAYPAAMSDTESREEPTSEVPHLGADATEADSAPAWNPDETRVYDLGSIPSTGVEAGTADQPDRDAPSASGAHQDATTEHPEQLPDQDADSYHRSPFRDRRGGPEPVPEIGQVAHSELDVVNARIHNEPDLGEDVIPPVQAFPDTSTHPSRIYATKGDIQAVNRRPRRFGGVSRPPRESESPAPVLRPSLGDFDVRKRMGQQAPPAVIWGGAAALAVLVVIAIVIFANRGSSSSSVRAINYPQRVLADINRLRTDVLPAQQNADVIQTRKDIGLARQNGTLPATIAAYNLQLQQAIDYVDHATRVTAPVVAANFTAISGANPTQLASGSSDIFVLDGGKKAVYSVAPNSAPSSSPTQIVQASETDSGIQVGTPMEIATAGAIALVLDDSNNLVLDNAGTKTAFGLTKASPAQHVTAMVANGTDVYMLDAVGGQIWKYASAASGVNSSPTGLFSATTDLSQAVSLTNDDAALYIMMKDGSVVKYDYQGNKQTIAMPQLRVPLQNPTAIFTDAGLAYLWIADPANNRVIQVNKKTGKYVRSYVPGTTAIDFTGISALVVPPNGKTLYVLSRKKLVDFPVTP